MSSESTSQRPELFWGMRGNGASFGIVTEFVVRLREMPNHGIIRGAPILWPATRQGCHDHLGRGSRGPTAATGNPPVRFLHAPDGTPMCGIVPLIVHTVHALLQTQPAPVLRGEVLPERVPAEGLLILRDGEPGEPG